MPGCHQEAGTSFLSDSRPILVPSAGLTRLTPCPKPPQEAQKAGVSECQHPGVTSAAERAWATRLASGRGGMGAAKPYALSAVSQNLPLGAWKPEGPGKEVQRESAPRSGEESPGTQHPNSSFPALATQGPCCPSLPGLGLRQLSETAGPSLTTLLFPTHHAISAVKPQK